MAYFNFAIQVIIQIIFLVKIITNVEVKALDETDYLYLDSLDYVTNETEYIEVLEKYFQEGGDIDSFVNEQKYYRQPGSILCRSIVYDLKKIIKFLLDHVADITMNCALGLESWNSLELVIFNQELSGDDEIYEIMKEKSLDKFSSYGFHQIHLDCATGAWFNVIRQIVNETDLISKTIDTNSPLWPGMTPLLLAARFYRTDIVRKLLDIGASPKERNVEGNTPLHYLITPKHLIGYLTHEEYFGDERLFIYDEEDTFGNYNGLSHFHIAILPYSSSVKQVENYLRLGVSPNLEIRQGFTMKDSCTSFDLLLKRDTGLAIKILYLLLEYGADPDKSCSHCGKTPLEKYISSNVYIIKIEVLSEFVCPLLEVGGNSDIIEINAFVDKLIANIEENIKQQFLKCTKRMLMISEALVTKRLLDGYKKVLNYTENFNETDYGRRCQQELKKLDKQGLRSVLDHSQVVKIDFKNNFGHLMKSSDLNHTYPIYGKILKVKLRRRLIEFERKKKKIQDAVSLMLSLGSQIIKYQDFNFDCAECILWHFDEKELDYFIQTHKIPEIVLKTSSTSNRKKTFLNCC